MQAERRHRVDVRGLPVRFSALKNMARSPQHYQHAAQFSDDPQPLCRKLGTVTHALVFEPHKVVVYRGGSLKVEKVKRGRKGKKGEPDQPSTTITVEQKFGPTRSGVFWKQFAKDNADKVIASPSEYETSARMAEALHANSLIAPLLFSPGMVVEQRIQWQFNGRWCAGTPDVRGLAEGYGLVVPDLKTARSAEPARFESQARWAGYHSQIAWYMDALTELGLGQHTPYLIAVESAPPYPCVPFRLTDAAIEAGRLLYLSWLERLKVCEDSDEWPGYSQSVVPFDVPPADAEAFTLTGPDGEEMEIS